MRFLLGGRKREDLMGILKHRHACLALFAAAEALGVGLVHGVPPYIYVHRLDSENVAAGEIMFPMRRVKPHAVILDKPQCHNLSFAAP